MQEAIPQDHTVLARMIFHLLPLDLLEFYHLSLSDLANEIVKTASDTAG